MTELAPDLGVIDAGPGGLAVAAGAAQMGASVVFVERGRMGGGSFFTPALFAPRTCRLVRLLARFG